MAKGSGRPRRRPLRALLVVLLIAGGGVATAVAPVACWVHGLVTDPVRYGAAVQPLAANGELRGLVTARVTAQVTSAVDGTSGTALQLPPLVQQLLSGAGGSGGSSIGALLGGDIHRVVAGVVSGPQFPALWATLARTAHPSVAALLTGARPTRGTVYLAGSQLMLDTTAVVHAVKGQLVAGGVPFAAQIPDTTAPVALARFSHLSRYLTVSEGLDRAAGTLPWLAGGLFLAAVVVARRRRRALAVVGLVVVASMGALTAARTAGPSWLTTSTTPHRRLVEAAFTALTDPLQHSVWRVAATGTAVLVLALLTYLLPMRRRGREA